MPKDSRETEKMETTKVGVNNQSRRRQPKKLIRSSERQICERERERGDIKNQKEKK